MPLGPRIPIKYNRNCLPAFLHGLLPSISDPRPILHQPDLSQTEFSKCVSSVRVGGTWKTTQKFRHNTSDDLIINWANSKSQILDVGASDGVTSLDLIKKLGMKFDRYIVTDAYLTVFVMSCSDGTYFYDGLSNDAFMKVTDTFVGYADDKDALFPFGLIARIFLCQAPTFEVGKAKEISLCQPELIAQSKVDPRLRVKEWNILTPWAGEMVDMIKVANVLNKHYFSNDKIKMAARNLYRALQPNGKLVIVENRDKEKISVFQKETNKFKLIRSENSGSEIEYLIQDLVLA